MFKGYAFRYRIIFFIILLTCYINASANINGIKIEIVEAQLYDTVHIPLLSKRINTTIDMFRVGYLQANQTTKALIKDDEYYIITLQDKHSSGKLNAIIKGHHLKHYQHHIGVLTQVSFLLSQDLIGKKYDKFALEKHLDTVAKKIIESKGFILDNDFEIGYSDILLYEDSRRELYKSYNDDVRPLEKKIRNNTLDYKDAFSFVYEISHSREAVKHKSDKNRKIAPLYRLVVFLHIPRNTKRTTEIIKLEKLREGSAKVDRFELSNKNVPFRINHEGSVILSGNLSEDVYGFEAIAHTKDGDSNTISFTIIIDKIKDTKYYKVK